MCMVKLGVGKFWLLLYRRMQIARHKRPNRRLWQIDPHRMAATQSRLHRLTIGVVHTLNLHIEIAAGVDDSQRITYGELVAGIHLHHATRRIKGHCVTHVQAAARFGIAAQVVLGFFGRVALKKARGVTPVGQPLELLQQCRIQLAPGH